MVANHKLLQAGLLFRTEFCSLTPTWIEEAADITVRSALHCWDCLRADSKKTNRGEMAQQDRQGSIEGKLGKSVKQVADAQSQGEKKYTYHRSAKRQKWTEGNFH